MFSIACSKTSIGWLVVGFASSGDFLESVVEDLLCDGLLAVQHQAVDELAREHRIVTRIAFELLACLQ